MARTQLFILNFMLFVGTALVLYFLPVLNLVSFSLILMGMIWLYIFHFRSKFFIRNHNRFSFFWFVNKIFSFLDKIPNKILREISLIFLPYILISLLSKLLKTDQKLWPFLIGTIIFEIAFVIVKLTRSEPNHPSK